ncbi:MAG: CoA pyrophosphatase [Ilumatobacteraceae bacterium]
MGPIVDGRRPGGDQVIARPAQFRVRSDHYFDNIDISALMSLDRVVERVVARSAALVQPPLPKNAKASAVLIALFQGDEGVEVVLTRRSLHITNHKGEISFPGGRVDFNEAAVDTALREADEEINLHPSCVEVIGQLVATSTLVSNSHIVPVVARLQDKPSLSVRNAEVDRAFSVPLSELIRTDTYSQEIWGLPPSEHCLHFFHLDNETIWGVTGRMLYQLLTVALAP